MARHKEQEMKEKQMAYWKKNIALIRNLLLIWALVSYVTAIFLAKPFYEIPFFGLNLSFWFAQQGSIIVFVILIFYYAKKMDHLDEAYDVKEVIATRKDDKGVSV